MPRRRSGPRARRLWPRADQGQPFGSASISRLTWADFRQRRREATHETPHERFRPDPQGRPTGADAIPDWGCPAAVVQPLSDRSDPPGSHGLDVAAEIRAVERPGTCALGRGIEDFAILAAFAPMVGRSRPSRPTGVALLDAAGDEGGPVFLDHRGNATCVAFSPDGRSLAVGGPNAMSGYTISRSGGRGAHPLGMGIIPGYGMAFSPDGHLLAVTRLPRSRNHPLGPRHGSGANTPTGPPVRPDQTGVRRRRPVAGLGGTN